ncbi:MAG: histidine kinase [Bacteroidota bacterium]|nr:histidine kinase [Bacteroidota bacterium]
MQKNADDIVVFLIIVSALILALAAFIAIMVYLYRKKQISFFQNLEQIKLDHEKTLMSAQLEMQESTFQHISREIHDNISLSLTLAKLRLNTLNRDDRNEVEEKVTASVTLLTQCINDLSDISKSLNSDIIKQQGLTRALEDEVQRIRDAGMFTLDSWLTGNPIYMDAQKELIIFRVIQEAFNNIIKHAEARHAELSLHYDRERLYIAIDDDGNGFDTRLAREHQKAGLRNMETRVKMLRGTMIISSLPEFGTNLSFTIPID